MQLLLAHLVVDVVPVAIFVGVPFVKIAVLIALGVHVPAAVAVRMTFIVVTLLREDQFEVFVGNSVERHFGKSGHCRIQAFNAYCFVLKPFQFYLKIEGSASTENKIIDSIGYTKKHTEIKSILETQKTVSQILLKFGFL